MSQVLLLEDFMRWKVPPLKEFLRKRGLGYSKNKAELAALCFAANKFNLPLKLSATDIQKEKALDYASLLTTEDGAHLPDPCHDLEGGWIGEEAGVKLWPPTMLLEIQEFILNLPVEQQVLGRRMLSDYKEGKAYSYFDAKWLKEVFYHPISSTSLYCFLRSECTPSQNIHDEKHKIWIAFQKKSGKVASAYCTCFAGLGSTCNHIGALLFKVENAWKLGLSNVACTSAPCGWNNYGAKPKQLLEPQRIEDMEWCKPHHTKTGDRKPINTAARRLFQPVQQAVSSPNAVPRMEGLIGSLFASCKEACAFQYVEFPDAPAYQNEDFNVEMEVEVCTSCELPPSLLDKAQTCTDVEALMGCMYLEAEVIEIERSTKGQAENEKWASYRKGMITASNIHSVHTKVKSLHDKPSRSSVSSLINRLLVISDLSNIPAINYGRTMEPEARKRYSMMKGHNNLCVTECGLFIMATKGYVGASPDALVSCSCCGEGLLEIKCPLSVAHTTPGISNLPFLTIQSDGASGLSRNHQYYSQIQTQMGVTNRRWCDFLVYTSHGYFLERVLFDQVYWENLLKSADFFMKNHLGPALIQSPDTINLTETETSNKMEGKDTAPVASCSYAPPTRSTSGRRRPQKKHYRKNIKPVYVCGECMQQCLEADEIQEESEYSVACDKCSKWFHFRCVSFDPDNETGEWLCKNCPVAARSN